MKDYIPLLIILQIYTFVTISVNQPVQSPYDSDDGSVGNIHSQEYEKVSQPSSCNSNQYFDEEQEQCLNIVGGGTLLYIDKTTLCGVNVLKPHCNNPKYYYICKKNKAILAQCGEDQQFSYDSNKCISNTQEQATQQVYPKRKIFDSIKLPACEKPGSFPIQGDCALFYTCEIKDSVMIQFIFKCPNTMIYDAEMEICSFSAICNDTNLNISSLSCVSDTEKGIILLQGEDQSRNNNILNEISTTDYTTNPLQFTVEDNIIDTTVATNNYESITTDEYNSFDILNSTENILDTTYSLNAINPITSTTSEELNSSFQAETTQPSLQISTSNDIVGNRQFDMVETTTEDSITSTPYSTSSIEELEEFEELSLPTQASVAPLQTSTEVEINLNGQTDTVITNTTNSNTEQETSDSIERFTEHSTTEFSLTDFSSTISSIELSVSPQFTSETTTSDLSALIDDLFIHQLPTTTTDSSISISIDNKDLLQTDGILTERSIVNNTSKENSASSALLSSIAAPDAMDTDETAASPSTDAANYFSTVSPENGTYGFEELIDTPSDIKQILQNFTSTLTAVSALESILATNDSSTLSKANKQPCEEMIRSLLADIKKNESFLKNETIADKQNLTVSSNINPRRTISSHIALPLASAVLNITDRFEHRIRNILKRIFEDRS